MKNHSPGAPCGKFFKSHVNITRIHSTGFRKAGWLGGRPIPAVAANDVCFAKASRAAEAVSGRNLRPVRVVRVAQGADLGGQETRLVISGRMSDVCAELDRLAAMESRMASA